MTHPYTDMKEAAEKATPGPWFNDGGNIWIDTREQVCCGRGYQECCGNPDIKGGQEQIGGMSENDAAFIALARNRLPDLLADYERMREALERVKMITQDSTYRACVVANDIARAALKDNP